MRKMMPAPAVRIYIKILLLFSAFIPINAIAQDRVELTTYHNQKELTANSSITLKPGFTITGGASARVYISTDNSVYNDIRHIVSI